MIYFHDTFLPQILRRQQATLWQVRQFCLLSIPYTVRPCQYNCTDQYGFFFYPFISLYCSYIDYGNGSIDCTLTLSSSGGLEWWTIGQSSPFILTSYKGMELFVYSDRVVSNVLGPVASYG